MRLGDLIHDSENDDSQPQDFTVVERIKHPNFKSPAKYDDIALLRLDRNVTFNQYVRPACLADQYKPYTKKAIASGWGLTEFQGKPSNALMKVVLELYSQQECNITYANDISRQLKFGIVEDTQLCAGSHTERKDTCQVGRDVNRNYDDDFTALRVRLIPNIINPYTHLLQGDSGGPLQVYHQSQSCMYEIVGVTSFGKGCGSVDTPGVYTRVYHYLEWIESIVWPMG